MTNTTPVSTKPGLFSKESYDMLAMFEREFKGRRLDKEDKSLWPKGIVFQDGHVNELFLAYRRGAAYQLAIDQATPAPSVPLGGGEECAVCGTGRAKRRLLTHKGTVLAMLVCETCGTEYAGAEQMEYNAPPTLQAQDAAPVEPIGHAVAVFMPGTCGFTMACFKASDVPPGTSIYASAPPAGVQGDAARLDWLQTLDGPFYNIDKISALGNQRIFWPANSDQGFSSLREAIDAAIASQAGKD